MKRPRTLRTLRTIPLQTPSLRRLESVLKNFLIPDLYNIVIEYSHFPGEYIFFLQAKWVTIVAAEDWSRIHQFAVVQQSTHVFTNLVVDHKRKRLFISAPLHSSIHCYDFIGHLLGTFQTDRDERPAKMVLHGDGPELYIANCTFKGGILVLSDQTENSAPGSWNPGPGSSWNPVLLRRTAESIQVFDFCLVRGILYILSSDGSFIGYTCGSMYFDFGIPMIGTLTSDRHDQLHMTYPGHRETSVGGYEADYMILPSALGPRKPLYTTTLADVTVRKICPVGDLIYLLLDRAVFVLLSDGTPQRTRPFPGRRVIQTFAV